MTTRALALLTRCSDAAEATALRTMLAEGGIESRGASGDGRAVVSNINPRGLDPARAAVTVADACVRILAAKKSGVVL